MRNLLFIILITHIFQTNIDAQIYGNTIENGEQNLNENYVTWWQIQTGASDSGYFTHLGIFVGQNSNANNIKMAIYDDDSGKPKNLLGDEVIPSPINDEYNEIALSPTISLSANTYYWIGIRIFPSGKVGENVNNSWSPSHKYFYIAHSEPWPDPANPNNAYGSPKIAIYACANDHTIPIELLSFNAKENQGISYLNWTTSTETNNSGWNIQRSNNGFTYETIGWVNGNQNSRDTRKYQFEDHSPKDGLNAYRLEQVDLDGKTTYSKHKSIYIKNKSIKLYPNPAKDYIYLNGIDKAKISILDASGKLIKKQDISNNQPINISSLNLGIYYLEVQRRGKTEQFRFMKNE